MGQILLHRRPHAVSPGPGPGLPARLPADPAAPARGILVALALSAIAWGAIGMVLAHLW